jgi:hypothetical protein
VRRLLLAVSLVTCASNVLAQAGPSPMPPGAAPDDPAAPSPGPAGTPGTGTVVTPGGGTVIVQPVPAPVGPYGPLGPAMRDPNQDLPSSSRPITGDTRDAFDLNQPSQGSSVVYGSKGASGVLTPQRPVQVPPIHVVRRGDTLWDLCGTYYQNPWGWPKVWSYNPQIVNPHWIYPGDQLRLRDPNDAGAERQEQLAAITPGMSFSNSGRRVTPNTVFLRDQGFLGDPKRDLWGELVGSVDDQMLLSDGNRVYIMMRPGVKVQPGQSLTVFNSVRKPEKVPGARQPPGEIVSVKGTVLIDQYNPKTRIARGIITESLDVIERGAKIGPVSRRFTVVAPKAAAQQVKARVLTSFYPHVFLAQNQLAFLDRGAQDGLEPGTRLFVLRQGDPWRNSLTVSSGMLKDRVRLDSNRAVDVETTPTRGDEKQFPLEIVAELRVLSTERYSSLSLVVESRRELTPGDVAVTLPER